MPTYELPNIVKGDRIRVEGKSLADAQQAAAKATGVTLAQQQAGGTFGAESLIGDTPTPNNDNDSNMAALREFFAQTAGFSREELAEKKRQFDATLTEEQRQFNERQASQLREFQADLGLKYLSFASTLGGPADVFQQADFVRGAQARPDVPVFLQSLLNNLNMPGFTGPGAIAPEPQTVANLAGRLTGTTSATTGGYDTDQALAAVGDVFRRGVTALAPNTLEQLNPSEVGILQSGAKKLGYDWNDLVNSYTKSRVGQRAMAPV